MKSTTVPSPPLLFVGEITQTNKQSYILSEFSEKKKIKQPQPLQTCLQTLEILNKSTDKKSSL